jgi:peptide deformylase
VKLVLYPDPILLQEASTVTVFDDSLRELTHEMKLFMKTLWGTPVGLAAPQIGASIKLCIAEGNVYVNPVIVKKSLQTYISEEGCYSLKKDRFDYKVERHSWVVIQFQRLNGKPATKRFDGASAQIIQHEVDHLYGKLVNGKGGK